MGVKMVLKIQGVNQEVLAIIYGCENGFEKSKSGKCIPATSTKKSRQTFMAVKMVLKNPSLGSACPETIPGMDHFWPRTVDSYPDSGVQ